MAADHNEHSMHSVVNTLSGRGGGPLQTTLKAGAIAITVLGAVPTAIKLYQSYTTGIPYSQVDHKLAQYKLWVKNANCRIQYKQISTVRDSKVDIGACPKSGDISIKVTQSSGIPTIEWIEFETLKAWAWLGGLIGTAHAGTVAGPAAKAAGGSGLLHLAQATTGPQVQCQGFANASTVVRIVNDGGKCFQETINAYMGKVTKRAEVACTTKCPGQK